VIQAAREYYDTLGVIFGDPIEDASRVVTPGENELVIFLGGAEVERHERELMHRKGVPVFPTPERGIKALAQVLDRKALATPEEPTMTVAAEGHALTPYESFVRVAEAGLPCTPLGLANNAANAIDVARQLGFPVALKISSSAVLHKSDVGGVRLNLESAEAVAQAYDEMMASVRAAQPDADLGDVLVSKMAAPGLEVIVGMNHDPQFGPVLLFGLGGVMVELFRDVSLRLLPLTREDALSMIREIKGHPLLAGYRGQPAVDQEALADCLLAVAELAERNPQIAEIDLNPVFAYPDGAVVVDARIIEGG